MGAQKQQKIKDKTAETVSSSMGRLSEEQAVNALVEQFI